MQHYEEPAPAFQIYAGDRMAELAELSIEERGAWISLVFRLWREGPLPEARMERIAGAHWKTVRFLFGIHSVPNGFSARGTGEHFSLKWLEDYRAFLTEKRRKNNLNAQKGGRPKKDASPTSPVNTGEKTERFPNGNHSEDRRLKIEEEREVEREEEDRGDGVQGKNHTAPVRSKFVNPTTDPRVQECIDFLTAARNGVSPDGDPKTNQKACAALLFKVAKDYPDFDAVDTVKAAITAGLADPFHAKNVTEFGYLLRSIGKIHASYKQQTTTPHGKRSATADVLAGL